ncbi:MAG TPA: class I SAM-dependent methyltransferase [Myxococcota bacterium]|nr:class I SAM-dependent methyltransferase [Myxococcota bacterium]HQK49566.1 class I SAM-dependent methyltransferase [Myxococcota bacterium]
MGSPVAFEDHFGDMAKDYARYRPVYPESLFHWLASIAPGRETAWDCGTGTGQAALGLAPFFQTVLATDPSPMQIAHAVPHPRVRYLVAPAEDSGLPSATVDLVTVAVAMHWFDLDRFYREVRRVGRPGAVLAAWCYTRAQIRPDIDALVEDFYDRVVGPYWPMDRRVVEGGYARLPFPFDEITPPSFEMTARWDLGHLAGYLATWSATRRATRALGRNPLEDLEPRLRALWGDPREERTVRWPLGLRVGRLPS